MSSYVYIDAYSYAISRTVLRVSLVCAFMSFMQWCTWACCGCWLVYCDYAALERQHYYRTEKTDNCWVTNSPTAWEADAHTYTHRVSHTNSACLCVLYVDASDHAAILWYQSGQETPSWLILIDADCRINLMTTDLVDNMIRSMRRVDSV